MTRNIIKLVKVLLPLSNKLLDMRRNSLSRESGDRNYAWLQTLSNIRRNKMPTIHENQFSTPIIEFEVAPEQQQAFIDGIADEVERYFKRYVGCVSASFPASDDGRGVINYV
jgi:hypothetical protein